MLRLLVIQKKIKAGVTYANATGLTQAKGKIQSKDTETMA